jgi:hypothetical protein
MTALLVAAIASSAAADPASDLADAEARVVQAEANVAAGRDRLAAARADYAAASRLARPRAAAAKETGAEARSLRSRLVERQNRARSEINEADAAHRQEEEDHDDEVTMGIGAGLALLVASLIALAWGWFRASAAVAALVRIPVGQAIALCLGGGFLVLVVGAALANGDGLIAGLGFFLFFLGFILPTALLLARHSAEIQRGRAKAAFGRGRLPDWVSQSAAAVLVLVGLAALGSAIFSDEPTATSISAQLQEDADALTRGPGVARLVQAKKEAAVARQGATAPLARQRVALADLRTAARQLDRARNRLAAAAAQERRSARRFAVVLEQEERQAQRQAEREAEEIEAIEEETEEASGCDPNYSGCVPPYPPDVDCPDVGETVSVYGSDPHGLDADNDGIGCE